MKREFKNKNFRLPLILAIFCIFIPIPLILTSCNLFFKNYILQVTQSTLKKPNDQCFIQLVNLKDVNKPVDTKNYWQLDEKGEELQKNGNIEVINYSYAGGSGKNFDQWRITYITQAGVPDFSFVTFKLVTVYGTKEAMIALTPEKAETFETKYLYDITYSITYNLADAGDTEHSLMGTAWLLSRIGSSGYTYYMATNQHVTGGRKYADSQTPASSIGYYYYTGGRFNSSSYIKGSSHFTFNVESPYNFFANGSGIDLSVIKAQFFNPDVNTKARLDRYNNGNYLSLFERDTGPSAAATAANNKITAGKTKVITAYPELPNQNTPFYTAGYPGVPSDSDLVSEFEFEYHKIVSLQSKTKREHDTWESDTSVYDKDQFVDNSPQLWHVTDKNYMNHGASGSALMNSNFEMVAIYWGGFSKPSPLQFDASYSMLHNVFQRSNLQKYLNGTTT